MDNNTNIPIANRAEVLIEALPYIQEYNGKIVVIKYGGNAMLNEELKQAVMGDILLLSLIGIKVVLVHGGALKFQVCSTVWGQNPSLLTGLGLPTRNLLILYRWSWQAR